MDKYKLIIDMKSVEEHKKVMERAAILIEHHCFNNKLSFSHASDFMPIFEGDVVHLRFHYALDTVNPYKTFSLPLGEFIGYSGKRCEDCHHHYYLFHHICRLDERHPLYIDDIKRPACVYFEDIKGCGDCIMYGQSGENTYGVCKAHDNKFVSETSRRCWDFKSLDWFKLCVHHTTDGKNLLCKLENHKYCPQYRTQCYDYEPQRKWLDNPIK